MASPSDVVREFCSAFPGKDLGTIERLLDDSAVYHNVGMEPAVGKDASLASIKGFFDMFESMEFKVLALAADGDTVLTERTDVLTANGVPAPLPVMGAFEVRDVRPSSDRRRGRAHASRSIFAPSPRSRPSTSS